MFGILLVIFGLLMLIIMLFAKPDCNNQISNAEALIFWISAIGACVAAVMMI